jgi:hypothetical protein
MVPRNVAESVRAPRPTPSEVRTLSAAETRRLLEAVRGDRLDPRASLLRGDAAGGAACPQMAGRGPRERPPERAAYHHRERGPDTARRAEDQDLGFVTNGCVRALGFGTNRSFPVPHLRVGVLLV